MYYGLGIVVQILYPPRVFCEPFRESSHRALGLWDSEQIRKFRLEFRVEFRVPTSLLTGEMARLCLFDVDGTLTAPRQVGSAREARDGGSEPLLP